jgi:acetyl esterase/lipase
VLLATGAAAGSNPAPGPGGGSGGGGTGGGGSGGGGGGTSGGGPTVGSCAVPGAPFSTQPPRASGFVEKRKQGYGTTTSQVADVYIPQPATTRPAVLLVHGGAWVTGSRADVSDIAEEIAQAGFVVVNADYTLATPSLPGYPMQVQDLQMAVRWMRAQAGTYGIDPSRIGAIGLSAGGTLVQLLATEGTGPCTSGDRIAVAVSWSGPTDLTVLDNPNLSCVPGKACGVNFDGLAAFAGCPSWSQCPSAFAAASPVNHVTSDATPMLLYNSTREVIPSAQATEMATKLSAARVPYEVTLLPGSGHAADYTDTALPGSLSWIARFIG